MRVKISSGNIKGFLAIPSSKSYGQRALALSAFSNGDSVISGLSFCEDELAAIGIISDLGAKITQERDTIFVSPKQHKPKCDFHCGESAFSARAFSVLAALYCNNYNINGSGSICNRNLGFDKDFFTKLGLNITTKNSGIPLNVSGKIEAINTTLDASNGSQFLSGLLMTLPQLKNGSTLYVENLKSKPYIDMTLQIMDDFGVKIEHKNYKKFNINGNQKFVGQNYRVESDWSSAAFFIVAAAISGEITLSGLNQKSLQADCAILDALKLAGGLFHFENSELIIKKSSLNSFEFNATDCPDLFPILTILAANASGISRIKGISRLKNKESDRASALQKELQILGIQITLKDDWLIVNGGKIQGGEVSSHNDHRIAMALGIAAISSKKPITINDAEVVKKSYPNFWKDLIKCNLEVKVD